MGSLSNGAITSIEVVVMAQQGSGYAPQAIVSSGVSDPNGANNTASASVAVPSLSSWMLVFLAGTLARDRQQPIEDG